MIGSIYLPQITVLRFRNKRSNSVGAKTTGRMTCADLSARYVAARLSPSRSLTPLAAARPACFSGWSSRKLNPTIFVDVAAWR